jgi:hypothetical protein
MTDKANLRKVYEENILAVNDVSVGFFNLLFSDYWFISTQGSSVCRASDFDV